MNPISTFSFDGDVKKSRILPTCNRYYHYSELQLILILLLLLLFGKSAWTENRPSQGLHLHLATQDREK
jgi:hypothetical protein